MALTEVIAQIDTEIARLQQARALLSSNGEVVKGKRGRPKGSKNAVKTAAPNPTKRRLSPEGRKAIADAMKRRWANRRKQAAK